MTPDNSTPPTPTQIATQAAEQFVSPWLHVSEEFKKQKTDQLAALILSAAAKMVREARVKTVLDARPHQALERFARWTVTGVPHATETDAVRLMAYVHILEQSLGKLRSISEGEAGK